jgi:hypothetical protein
LLAKIIGSEEPLENFTLFSKQTRISALSTLIIGTTLLCQTISAAPKPTQLGTFVVLGDSLSAGFQNFSLYDTGQNAGFAALIAQQAGVSLPLPLISSPGLPNMLTLSFDGTIPVIGRAPGFPGGRENPTVQAYDLSVPGFTIGNTLSYSVNTAQPITNPVDALALSILAIPGSASNPPCGVVNESSTGVVTMSEVACGLKLKPQTILASVGNNDALQSLTSGTNPTDPLTFTLSYAVFLTSLSTTHAKIVVANVPDVTSLPFLVPVPAFQAQCPSSPLPAGTTSADYVVPNIEAPVFGGLCNTYAVRKASLINQTRNAIQTYNAIIKEQASIFGAVVVDVNGLLGKLAQTGITINGDHLTTQFLGGLFSLDGIHPTNTGYAILANLYIDTMNAKLGTAIPEVNVATVEKNDPLVLNK